MCQRKLNKQTASTKTFDSYASMIDQAHLVEVVYCIFVTGGFSRRFIWRVATQEVAIVCLKHKHILACQRLRSRARVIRPINHETFTGPTMSLYHQWISLAGNVLDWIIETARERVPICAIPLNLLNFGQLQLFEVWIQIQ